VAAQIPVNILKLNGIYFLWLLWGVGINPPYGNSPSECLSPIILHRHLYIY
jgi:hypothetical protein